MRGVVSALRGVLGSKSSNARCFGVPLKDYVEANGGYLPPVIGDCVKYLLDEEHVGIEGLFRVPGSGEQLRLLKAAYDAGEIPDLSCQEVFTVCSLLAQYLRELPQSLVPVSTCDTLKDHLDNVQWMQGCVCAMSFAHRQACNLIFKLAKQMTLHAHSNKMTANNIAICLTPDLVREDGADAIFALASSSRYGSTIAVLVEHYDEVFERVESERLALVQERRALSSICENDTGDEGAPQRVIERSPEDNPARGPPKPSTPITLGGSRGKAPLMGQRRKR